jgi:hypothetical protein
MNIEGGKMKNSLTVIFIIGFVFSQLSAQDKNIDSFGITFSGFVKTDIMFDSRQTVSAREGHFLLYPAAENPDVNGDDINDKSNLNILSVQSRLTGKITGPEFLGAKTSGVLEGAFFGHSDGDINGFRLRHAFVKLDWKKSSLLVGQYWSPMFITECFPGVVSFNTGVPFQPFSRNPQIRFVQKFDNVQLTLVAASQRDFASTGPAGTSSSYLRNSVIPIMNANLKYVSKNTATGFGINYMSLTPRLVTDLGYKTDKKISGISLLGFAKYDTDKFALKLEAVYGQNTTDLLMLGGYAVKSQNASNGEQEYTPINILSLWTDIIIKGEVEFGLFAGYTKNLGSSDNITGTYYSRGDKIADVMRVSPRIMYKIGKTAFACEVEYTSADYGIPTIKGEVENTTSVANLRTLFAAYLFF